MSDEHQVQQVLARYARAVNRRDGAALAMLFDVDGRVDIGWDNAGTLETLITLTGHQEIADAVANKKFPPGARGRALIHGHIIEVNGDRASLEALFEEFVVRPGDEFRPGRSTIEESGEYRSTLRRNDGQWKLVHHQVVLDTDPRRARG
ncbi:SnoaL-like domain-containing protein [Micromonospora rhizosphaerae]|uniref:SnoaL-like domain-containing protein n=1 Tax=Micromonospora rhizosphaerae TaxID=568872 RepID=A0A1C6SXN2_9ACTN|nr:nuclear transport factor 2 family protein [Micromonospora rhizosphaerae]SCL34043.1 SnoaL-like domain-containing protein [Micromonospora rhizosphaerae]